MLIQASSLMIKRVMRSLYIRYLLKNRNVKQINKTDISVIHTTGHFQSENGQ